MCFFSVPGLPTRTFDLGVCILWTGERSEVVVFLCLFEWYINFSRNALFGAWVSCVWTS